MPNHPVGKTQVALTEAVRQSVVELLNQTLADVFDLYSQTKQAHWTVRSPQFWQLHKLFDDVAAATEEHIDVVAERIATLGGLPLGTVRAAAAASKVPEFPAKFDDMPHVAALAQRYAVVANSVRENIDKADELGDKTSADLFTQVSRSLDLQLWFLEAHGRS
ncbi:MAG TPA: DNA starvation/stationary phase protection protein Dps [Pirellulaceae bacterium]|nr:DNA starvation/stationary phase protection protein Dps [Pirellulaceae bacterium]